MTIADPTADRLLRSTARQSYDPEVDLDWEAAPVEGLWWMQPERVSLYGTPTWDRLSPEQQIELSRHEVASIMSVGLWFEVLLMQLLLREVYGADPRTARTQYALTEIGDETRHSVMFGRAIAAMGAPAYGPRPAVLRVGKFAPLLHGPSVFSATLVGEEPLDRWQRELMKDERCQPLTRMASRIHVTEEARHVTFAREELAAAMSQKIGRTQLRLHQNLTARAAYVMARSLVHPDCYAAIGLDPMAARREALGNEHYRATLAWMGEKMMPYLIEHGMVSEKDRKIWRASFLVPRD
ncbi:diiron oxygenase [Nocardioides sp.]|uniref:AurF N-oxygenase family protein n=1 Tax=Nocardioides sp. TaxID=35761 RepID=UPI0019C5BFA0|nr:diiron oxygenase [Nocardioides sp.]MBC7276683.1 diiron oxygenase [Nocardioides sp.]